MTMKAEQLTLALETAARQLGVVVRYETMTGETAGAAGLCRIKGEWRVIMDKRTPTSDRVAILAQALTQFDTESVFLPPEARRAIEARAAAHPDGQAIPDPAA